MAETNGKHRPHAVMVPVPAQGHINPMMKIAKLLNHRGFHITFVNTEVNHRRLFRFRSSNTAENLPHFQFEAIPDGLSYGEDDAFHDAPTTVNAIQTNLLAPFRELIHRLNDSDSPKVPPVTCIVSDGCMSFTLDVAEELDIPEVLLWTHGACGVMAYANFHKLVEKGFTPLKDSSFLTNGYLEKTIDWIPSMKGIRLKDFPTLIRTTDPDDVMVHFNIRAVERSLRGSAIVVNTFDALEHGVLTELKSMFPNISTIGPLQLLENQIPGEEINSFGTSLWKEDSRCLEWLDSHDSKSVLYVNFGSIAQMTAQELAEFAWGLANSDQNFLWIIRSDLVSGDSAILPPEFEAEIEGRGLLLSWCNQERVLNHQAVGGFLTHCGWNSIIESICAGVPMICWPALFEQTTNCWFCCNHWGIGLEIDSEVKRENVGSLVRELMVGEKGKEMRVKAMAWKKSAEDACSNGSSKTNFEQMIEVLISKFKQS